MENEQNLENERTIARKFLDLSITGFASSMIGINAAGILAQDLDVVPDQLQTPAGIAITTVTFVGATALMYKKRGSL